jgi:hypothetical protein
MRMRGENYDIYHRGQRGYDFLTLTRQVGSTHPVIDMATTDHTE